MTDMQQYKRVLLCLCVALCGLCHAQQPDLSLIPKDIKVSIPERLRTSKIMSGPDSERKTRAANEFKRLIGPCELIPGELVSFSYPWQVSAVLKGDPSKTLREDFLRHNMFRFVGGADENHPEIALITTGQVVVLSRPDIPTAPKSTLLKLQQPETIIGMSKSCVKNRCGVPTKIGRDLNDHEMWTYHGEVLEDATSSYTVTKNSGGSIFGKDGSSVQRVYTKVPNVPFVLWNFTLHFDEEGNVEEMRQGELGQKGFPSRP